MESNKIGIKELKLKYFEMRSGIYYLYYKGEIVYVGQAVNISRRVIQHITDGVKIFDEVRYDLIPVESLNDIEATLIRTLKPKYNVSKTAEPVKMSRRSSIHFRAIALAHHRRNNGTIPIKIRFSFRRRYIYLPVNLYAYLEDTKNGNVVSEKLLEDLKPILKVCADTVKYVSDLETFEYVRNKVRSIRI